LRLPGHGLEIPALPGQAHPHDGEYDLGAAAPVRGNGLQRPGGESQASFGLFQ